MNNYEILYIIKADVEEGARDAVIARYETLVKEKGGEVQKTEKWGMKKFAYPINFKDEGFYVLMNFSSDATLPKEIDRQMRISDEVVRLMILKK